MPFDNNVQYSKKIQSRCRRNSHGNALVMTLATTIACGWVLLYFGWQYTKQLGGYQEQKTAIEAAALAAAKDLSRIVVEDPNVGYVALSDYAPVGKNVLAQDGFAVSVQGINTLLATARLDMIIADYMQDPVMQQLALTDYNNAIAAQTRLVNVLQTIIPSGGTYNPSGVVGYDIDGNIVNPVQDAINAYVDNQIRIAGRPSLLVPNSLKLQLGFVSGLQTSRAPLPQPVASAGVPSNQEVNGYYLPNVQIYYNNGTPIVFAALSTDTTVVDFRSFQTNVGVNGAVPTVVRCDADQRYYDFDAFGNAISNTIHAAAAAEAYCILDQRPNPGNFSVTMLGGQILCLQHFSDLYNNLQLLTAPTDMLQMPLSGDYPQTALSSFIFPANNPFPNGVDPSHPPLLYLFSVSLYDWIRRAGMNVNISQITNTLMNSSLIPTANGPTRFTFSINSSGNLVTNQIPATNTNLSVSQDQWRAISGLGLTDTNNNTYDLQITNFCYQPGRQGGQHWGEPLNNPGQTGSNAAGANYVSPSMFENTTWPYQEFLAGPNGNGTTVRPTYMSPGIAADYTFRLRP